MRAAVDEVNQSGGGRKQIADLPTATFAAGR